MDEASIAYAWKIINDSYYSKVLLKYPPYIIALASLVITRNAKSISGDKIITRWLNNLDPTILDFIQEVIEEIFTVYSKPGFTCLNDFLKSKINEKLKKMTFC